MPTCLIRNHFFVTVAAPTLSWSLQGFGTRVLAYDIRPNPALSDFVEYVDLETLLRESHLVSLHCPLLPSTFHLIDKKRWVGWMCAMS